MFIKKVLGKDCEDYNPGMSLYGGASSCEKSRCCMYEEQGYQYEVFTREIHGRPTDHGCNGLLARQPTDKETK
jgi:hypothetical protein